MQFNVNTGLAMATYRHRHSLIHTWLCITFLIAVSTAEECDKSKCPGPIQYYEDLSCTPIYKTKGSCCPIRYQCDHLENRSTDKCYYKSHVYEIGEELRKEDANPCDIGCFCRKGYRGIAEFTCAVVDCFAGPPKPDCYRQNSPFQCCPGEEICPEKDTDRPTCIVDGKTYRDGDHFEVKSEPEKNCYCMEGYKGKNIAPFCRQGGGYCGTELRHASDIHDKCVPVYYNEQPPATSCSVFTRCQNANDTVIPNEDSTKAEPGDDASDSAATCSFGTMTMKIGDQLNQATDYSSVCVKCICEVPPVPTCQRLPDKECDVTVHPPFSY